MTEATLVVDASVAIKWYLPEPGSAEADLLLTTGNTLIAPDFLATEIANILRSKAGRGDLDAGRVGAILDRFLRGAPLDLHPSVPLSQSALTMGLRLRHPVYDCLYVALAQAERCQLVTADGRLLRAVRGTELESYVRPLVP